MGVECVELGSEYHTKDLRDRTLPQVWLADDEEQTLVFDHTGHRTSEALEHALRDLLSPEYAHEELVPYLVEDPLLSWDIVDLSRSTRHDCSQSFLVAVVISVFESNLSYVVCTTLFRNSGSSFTMLSS